MTVRWTAGSCHNHQLSRESVTCHSVRKLALPARVLPGLACDQRGDESAQVRLFHRERPCTNPRLCRVHRQVPGHRSKVCGPDSRASSWLPTVVNLRVDLLPPKAVVAAARIVLAIVGKPPALGARLASCRPGRPADAPTRIQGPQWSGRPWGFSVSGPERATGLRRPGCRFACRKAARVPLRWD